MPSVLPNTTTTDKYVQLLGGEAIYDRGQFLIANNPVSLIVQHGPDKSTYTETEYPYLTPTTFPFIRSAKEYIIGVKAKSAIVGTPAQVSGFLLEPDVAGVGIGAAFLANVSASGIVQTGATLVAGQVDLNFVATSRVTAAVVFPAGSFTAPPRLVLVSIQELGSTNNDIVANVDALTKDGFTFNAAQSRALGITTDVTGMWAAQA